MCRSRRNSGNTTAQWLRCPEKVGRGRHRAITIPIRNGCARAVRGTALRPFFRIPSAHGSLGSAGEAFPTRAPCARASPGGEFCVFCVFSVRCAVRHDRGAPRPRDPPPGRRADALRSRRGGRTRRRRTGGGRRPGPAPQRGGRGARRAEDLRQRRAPHRGEERCSRPDPGTARRTVRDDRGRRRQAQDLLHRPPQPHPGPGEVPGDPLGRDLAERQPERGEDPLDPPALLPPGRRPGRARRRGRNRSADRADRRRRDPGRHLALLGQRRCHRVGQAGGEARRLAAPQRAQDEGAPGLADPGAGRRLRPGG